VLNVLLSGKRVSPKRIESSELLLSTQLLFIARICGRRTSR
jgi:hypothetical protein